MKTAVLYLGNGEICLDIYQSEKDIKKTEKCYEKYDIIDIFHIDNLQLFK